MTGSGPARLPPPWRSLPERSHAPEILDRHGSVSAAQHRRSLVAMARVNHCLGGTRSLLAHLRPLIRTLDNPELSLLDVGVGLGEVPRMLVRTLARDGFRVSWTGADLSQEVLRLAAASGPRGERAGLVRADGLRLPFRDGAFDIVVSTLTLHHLDDAEALAFLCEARRVASLAVVVSDLERHPLHYLGARLLGATWWRHDPVTRFDGPLSVLRSFTRPELEELGRRVSFRRMCVRRHLPFRIVLEGRP